MRTYTYTRYLSAKKTVDDRALNRHVLERLRLEQLRSGPDILRVAEIGAGLGTMIVRLLEWNIVRRAEYLALDADAELLRNSSSWLAEWGEANDYEVDRQTDQLRIRSADVDVTVRFVNADVLDFLRESAMTECADLLIANAFLDLVELPRTLEQLLSLLKPSGLYWFSINYDGHTVFLPEHIYDDDFMRVYNGSMDERTRCGRRVGDSKTGRHLFDHLHAAGASILASGASDWVVHAGNGAYEADEEYFLHHIVHTVDEELKQHSGIPPDALAKWVAVRHAQIERGELVYIAHQLDFAGRPRRGGQTV